jgi:putative copper export protein
VRYGLLAVLGVMALGQTHAPTPSGPFRRTPHVLFAALSVALLATFSVTSHAASMGGRTPFLVDLTHFAAACAWAGPLFYLAVYPGWQETGKQPLHQALGNLSSVGLLSVGLLFASGIYSSLLHLQDPPAFVASPYGRVLGVKLFLVFVIVALAGINRVWLLPRFSATGGGSLRMALRAELAVLVTVFVATGVLSTSPLPHSGDLPGVIANLRSFWTYLIAP